jgi:phospholipid/cholesterol/gamma-HCH transport system permease protein
MDDSSLNISFIDGKLSLKFFGEFTLFLISKYNKQIDDFDILKSNEVVLDLEKLLFLDTAAALFIESFIDKLNFKNIKITLLCSDKDILGTLELIKNQKISVEPIPQQINHTLMYKFGYLMHYYYTGFVSFMSFIGILFSASLSYLKSVKNIRFKEIAFEINESAVKALWIISLTSFLLGLVVAYQSAYQLKIYGANIFIVDMLGISILRELAPLITAVVIAGRSGSAFTAQIGAMKITQELDAMRSMGFNPYLFLALPRIIALMITMPILIFVADATGVLGGMLVANLDLNISIDLFIARFNDVVAAKHFYIGIAKGPFFAFLIASIGIYRGLMVKDDTQSIGFNTTKSVVESIFAVIICDAIFSIAFTNLGI